MRGRLIFPVLAEIYPLHVAAEIRTQSYDEDFRELKLLDLDGDGVSDRTRQESALLRIPCQVEPTRAFEEQRMTGAGNAPRSDISLVFHFEDLERLGLVDGQTQAPALAVGDRLAALYELGGPLMQRFDNPPGLFAVEVQPRGFGLGGKRNLLLVSFESRPVAATRVP